MAGIYIHVPFCKTRCAYCDFFSTTLHDMKSRYVDALCQELVMRRNYLHDAPIDTLYFGGGTPSQLSESDFHSIFNQIEKVYGLEACEEITLEANPDDLTDDYVEMLTTLPFNRISMGIQTFHEPTLQLIGRRHTAQEAIEAVHRCQQHGFTNISIDLMCGIPGQTPESFAEDVREALRLGVKHLSVYPLAIEEGTPFWRMVEADEMPEPDPDMQAAMMEEAARILCGAGMHRYEVASYAYPGYESRHNRCYWTGKPYLGIGRSAVTMRQDGACRERVRDGEVEERLDARQMAAEDLMLGMRMTRGVSEEQVRAASKLLEGAAGAFLELQAQGLVALEEGRYVPTERGWLLGNELYGRLLDLAP